MVSSLDKREEIVFLSLGSNLGVREKNLSLARDLIADNIGKIKQESRIYKTDAWGNEKLNWFFNQVVSVASFLDAKKVLELCLEIESSLGRRRGDSKVFENRIIDIDLLLYGNKIIHTPSLSIPHPRLHLRNFVLYPLAEIAPKSIHPSLGLSIQVLKNNCTDSNKIEPIE